MTVAIRWGLIIGVGNLVWLYASFWLGLHTNGPVLFQVVPAAWLLITIVGFARAMREVHAGAEPQLLRGVKTGGAIAVITAVIAVIMQVGYYTVIHPEWPEVMAGQTRDYFAARGASAAEVEARVSTARETFTLPRYATSSAILALVAGFVLAPLITLIQKRRWRRSAGMTGALPAVMLLCLMPGFASAQQAAGQPQPRRAACDTPEHRAFDFWVGSWVVELPNGSRSGTNRIELVLGNCALHESWTGDDGNRGHSYSVFDASVRQWHQTWVDIGGNVLRLDGGLEGATMVLRGVNSTAQGRVHSRISWTPHSDGRVRQHWEISMDGGTTWQTYFDGWYRRAG